MQGWGLTVLLGIHASPKLLPLHPMELFDGRKIEGSVFGGFKGKSQLPNLATECMKGVMFIISKNSNYAMSFSVEIIIFFFLGDKVGWFHHSRTSLWRDKQSLRSFDCREVTEMSSDTLREDATFLFRYRALSSIITSFFTRSISKYKYV